MVASLPKTSCAWGQMFTLVVKCLRISSNTAKCIRLIYNFNFIFQNIVLVKTQRVAAECTHKKRCEVRYGCPLDGIATQIKYLCKSQVSGYRNVNYVLYVEMAKAAIAGPEKT